MKKRTLLLTMVTAFILALTACGVAEKTPEGEDTGITQTENPNNDQYYVPLDTDGDGEEDQAIVIIPANGGNENTPEEDYTPVSEMTFEKRPEIDSDGMFMQYGPILIEFGVSSMEDIEKQLNNAGIPQWEVNSQILVTGLGCVSAGIDGRGGLAAYFINFEEGNEWGYEPGYRAVYAGYNEPDESNMVRATINNIWYSDSAAAFFEEHCGNFNRDNYNDSSVFWPLEDDYYSIVLTK